MSFAHGPFTYNRFSVLDEEDKKKKGSLAAKCDPKDKITRRDVIAGATGKCEEIEVVMPDGSLVIEKKEMPDFFKKKDDKDDDKKDKKDSKKDDDKPDFLKKGKDKDKKKDDCKCEGFDWAREAYAQVYAPAYQSGPDVVEFGESKSNPTPAEIETKRKKEELAKNKKTQTAHMATNGKMHPRYRREDIEALGVFSKDEIDNLLEAEADSNGNTKCWPGYKKQGMKKSPTDGKPVNNCVKEDIVGYMVEKGIAPDEESAGLIYDNATPEFLAEIEEGYVNPFKAPTNSKPKGSMGSLSPAMKMMKKSDQLRGSEEGSKRQKMQTKAAQQMQRNFQAARNA